MILIMSFVSSAFFLIQPMVGKLFIDEVFIAKTVPFQQALGLVLLALIATISLSMLTKYIYLKIGLHILFDMRTDFYEHLLKLPFQTYEKIRVGDMTSRMNEDIAEIKSLYTDSLLQLVQVIFTFILSFTFLLSLHWKMALLSFASFPLLVYCSYLFKQRLFTKQMELRSTIAKQQSFLVETLSSIRYIRATSMEKKLSESFQSHLKEVNQQSMKMSIISATAQGIPQALLLTATFFVIWFLGIQVIKGTFTLGALLAFTAYLAQSFSAIQGLSQLYLRFQKGKASIVRVLDFLSIPSEPDGNKTIDGSIETVQLQSIDFSFSKRNVLRNLHLTLHKGDFVTIVGESGSGKSTLVNLLARVLNPIEGAIFCNKTNISELSKNEWHCKVVMVAHDFPIWYGTIEDHLRLGKSDATLEEMNDILKRIGLCEELHSSTTTHDDPLRENAMVLSAGQQQRLHIAKALLQRPDVLILDEATCHLDQDLEKHILHFIAEKMEDKIVLMITHRIENVERSTKAFEMKNGILTEVKRRAGEKDDKVAYLFS